MKIELFRVGKFNGKKFTLKNLESIVANSDTRKVPISLGHDTHFYKLDDQPALGVVVNQRVEGDSLVGELDLNAKGKEVWASKEYPNWSVGIARSGDNPSSMWLHHLALLGVAPPAVPDLKTFSNMDFFSIDGETKNIELLTYSKGEIMSAQKPTEKVELQDFSKTPEWIELKAEKEAALKAAEEATAQLKQFTMEKENQAVEMFRSEFSKDFKTEDLDELLTNKKIDSEILGVFKKLLDNRLNKLPEGDILNHKNKVNEVLDYTFKGV